MPAGRAVTLKVWRTQRRDQRIELQSSPPAPRGRDLERSALMQRGASSSSSHAPASLLHPEEAVLATHKAPLPLDDPRRNANRDQLRHAPTWAITATSIAFMSVPRSIPACFALTGWPLGICALLYSSIVTYDTGCIIGELCRINAKVDSFPALVAEVAAQFSARSRASAEVGNFCRLWAHRATLALQFSTYYLTTVAELIYFEQFAGQLWPEARLCQWQWLLVVSLVSLPFLQLPTFSATRWVAVAIGLAPLVINVLVFFYEIALVQPWKCLPGPSYDGSKAGGRSAEDKARMMARLAALKWAVKMARRSSGGTQAPHFPWSAHGRSSLP